MIANATSRGYDTANLEDSTGDDVLIGAKTYTSLSGTGFAIRANKFEKVIGSASNGGVDRAYLTSAAVGDPPTSKALSAKLLWLYDFDEIHNKVKNQDTLVAAVDDVLKGYWL